MVTHPWRESAPIRAEAFARIRRRMIFDFFKWDPQAQDTSALSPTPMVLRREAWEEIRTSAEALFVEALACESELLDRPELHRQLGLPRATRAALASGRRAGSVRPGPRVMRFDFHPTAEGWRVSEVNADVPGGYIEASAFAALVAEECPGAVPAGDPAAALANAVRDSAGAGARVALVHATAYSDDAQVMRFLATHLAARGLRPVEVAPSHLRWSDGRASLATDWTRGEVDVVLRFFPAEWLAGVPGRIARPYFRPGAVRQTNPASAILIQSKRLPLVWDQLRCDLAAWRRLLPATVDPRDAPLDDGWVLKPALGRVGEGVGIRGVTDPRLLVKIQRASRFFPSRWVAQRRFAPLPWLTEAGRVHPCLGVFVVDGRAAGIYGRIAARALVDGLAADVAVLLERDGLEAAGPRRARAAEVA